MEIFPGNISGNISGNNSKEINNRFPEIFPCENFLKTYMKFLKIAFVHLKIDIEFLGKNVKIMLINRLDMLVKLTGKTIFTDGFHWNFSKLVS